MADPIGENAYLNLAAPLYGEAEFQQLTTNTILTLQHTTDNAGRFFLGRDFVGSTESSQGDGSSIWNNPGIPYSSVLTDVAVWDIDNEGGYRVLSGTTVLVEFNSSGIFGRDGLSSDTEWRIDSSGRPQGVFRTVTTITTGANFVITSTQSGMFFYVQGQSAGTSMYISLPGDAAIGTYYDFGVTSQAALSDVIITSTAGGAAISMPGLLTSVVSTNQAMTPATLQSIWVRLTLVETDLWYGQTGGYEHSSADTTDWTSNDLERGSWQPNTTIG